MLSVSATGYDAAMRVRAAVEKDIEAICGIEAMPEYRGFIGQWSAEEHRRAMVEADARYLTLADDEDRLQGFAIVRGVLSEHRSLELKRIAVREPGRGYGRTLLRAAAELAFCGLGAHRLWLDVFERNPRAQHVYEEFGFRVEGVSRESILLDGRFYSMVLMSMLEEEYREPWG